MRRSRRGSWDRMRRCARRVLACIGLMLTAAGGDPASGHSFSIGRGTADVSRDRIVLTLETDAADLLRHGGFRPAEGGFTRTHLERAVARHERWLLDVIVIRDASGAPLRGRILDSACRPMPGESFGYETLHQTHVIHMLKYETPEPVSLLTFQLRGSDGPAAGPAQWVLAVRSRENSDVRVIRLTSRGNAETLSFGWIDGRAGQGAVAQSNNGPPPGPPPSHTAPEQKAGDERFGSIQAVVRMDEAEVRCDVYLPLVLAETWMAINRADRDFVSPAEFAPAEERLCALVASRNELAIDGAAPAAGGVSAEFLGPEEFVADGNQPRRRLSAWTARVAITQRFAVKTPPNELELAWGLFNGMVLTADATVVCGESSEKRRISTYDPVLKWSRGGE